MSNLLWKYYHEDNVDRFRHLLAPASYTPQHASTSLGGGSALPGCMGALGGSLGGHASSFNTNNKGRKTSGQSDNAGSSKGANNLTRADINSKDYAGLTILHRCAASNAPNATSYAMSLIEHPLIDLDVRDLENGWTALHRALYFGNIRVAHAIISRDARDRTGHDGSAAAKMCASMIKIPDFEGNCPFDIYNATIARRSLEPQYPSSLSDSDVEDEDDSGHSGSTEGHASIPSIDGDEVFAFGSNKNFSLGFADQDDRHYPEKIILKRPDHLYFRFYQEYVQSSRKDRPKYTLSKTPSSVSDLPSMILSTPITIQDVKLSKLHSAILTTDPESNLYMCGFGPGGRLGLGDEITRFTFCASHQGALTGKKIAAVALGKNHSLAISDTGEIYSWGTNTFGQLGYSLSQPKEKNEEPSCSTPRQIFGPLKRETIIGVAASAIHSVAFTSTSLYCWGKNEGQLGLMDSSSRSLEAQLTPRKVGASLFKSSIMVVSAINSATTCLLADHTVCVFTNYGYNIVKFPLNESFSNYHLQSTISTRYDDGARITSIESGGDTIAAISSRGDLFTVNVRKPDVNDVAASTTNPNKIKSALSSPQRIWSLRKGNWDGVKSVSIADNKAVIVCTQAGAVWRQVRRVKAKDAFASTTQKLKDWKFHRVPNLTKVAAVRSTPFGNYAAIRKDCDITKTQVLVSKQALWDNVKPLLSIRSLEASELTVDAESKQPRFWVPSLPKELFEPWERAVLKSPDLEADLERHCASQTSSDFNVELCSTTSSVGIPIHGFMLAGRSLVIRRLLSDYRTSDTATKAEVLHVEKGSNGRIRLVFQGLDIITLVNLACYIYTDKVIEVWSFTKQNQSMAFRYRQVRVELMKTATHLKMMDLEASVRLMGDPEPQMNLDIAPAIQDLSFFQDGDIIVELNGSETMVHSSLMCQRCPFFEALFKGRSGGQWLAGRRQNQLEPVRVDLKHIAPETFRLVLRYLYADAGTELFDDVVSADIDEFSEQVLDVLAVADELMLDRLSQVCQQLLGRFVTTRNVCQILNAVAPCSVTGFKDAALEYICLQLEAMLENHLLDSLESDLFSELDQVVQANQLNCLPFVKSGRAELLLHEQHPSLVEDIDEERQRRLRDMVFKTSLRGDDNRLSTSLRNRMGSLDDHLSPSPGQETRRGSKASHNAPFSPSIRSKDSKTDLIFSMDEDASMISDRPKTPKDASTNQLPPTPSKSPQISAGVDKASMSDSQQSPGVQTPLGLAIRKGSGPTAATPKMWSPPMLPPAKLDMKEIMAQASTSEISGLSTSLPSEKLRNEAGKTTATPKLSQKERKKQQQHSLLQTPSPSQPPSSSSTPKSPSPWQVASGGSKTNLKDVLNTENKASPSPALTPVKSLEPSSPSIIRRTASPDTRFAGQRRPTPDTKSSSSLPSRSHSSSSPDTTKATISSPLVPHSKQYLPPAAEPALQLSLKDIIGQQEREIEVRKEAVAKRSLQEIQEEQAFQEWWDEESKRVRAAEEKEREKERRRSEGSGSGRGKGKERGRGGGRGGRGRGKGKGKEKTAEGAHGKDEKEGEPSKT